MMLVLPVMLVMLLVDACDAGGVDAHAQMHTIAHKCRHTHTNDPQTTHANAKHIATQKTDTKIQKPKVRNH